MLTVQTQEQISKQDITSLGEAFERLPGVTFVEGGLGAGVGTTNISSRGGLPISRIQIDGGVARDLDLGAEAISSLDAYERVELIRGPNALFGGAGSPGGVINLVRKRPADADRYSIVLEGGSYDRLGIVGDMSQANIFGSPINFRSVLSYRQEGENYENYGRKSYNLYGIFDIPLGEVSRLEIGGNYSRIRETGNYLGLPRYVDASLIDVGRSYNIIRPATVNGTLYSPYRRTESYEIFSKFVTAIGSKWTSELSVSYFDTNADSILFSLSGLNLRRGAPGLGAGGEMRIGGRTFSSNNLSADFKVSGQFETFGLKHDILLNAGYNQSSGNAAQTTIARTVPRLTTLDRLLNPVFVPLTPATIVSRFPSRSEAWGVVISDSISWNDRVIVNAAVRRDFVDSTGFLVNTRNGAAQQIGDPSFDQLLPKSAWTPTFSLLIKPLKSVSIFASYASGFERQDGLYTRVDEGSGIESFSRLRPAQFKNVEIGVKYGDDRISGSISYYRMRQTGQAVQDPNFASDCPPTVADGGFAGLCYVQADGSYVISRGVDAEVAGRIGADVTFTAAVNYNNSKFLFPELVGVPFGSFSPAISASLFLEWKATESLSLNTGLKYKGRVFQDGVRTVFGPQGQNLGSEDFTLNEPSSAVVDLGVEYKVSKHLRLSVLLENVTNEKYISTISFPGTSGGNVYGQPRTVLGTFKWSFEGERESVGGNGASVFGRPESWYFAYDLGYDLASDFRSKASGVGTDGESPIEWNFALKNRPAFLGRVGYGVNDHLRVELEAGYRSSPFGAIGSGASAPFGVCDATGASNGAPFDCDDAPGSLKQLSLMVNSVWDFGGKKSPIRPFLGGGAGVVRTLARFSGKLDGVGGADPWVSSECFDDFGCVFFPNDERKFQESIGVNDIVWRPAFQAIAGVSMKLGPRARIDLSYRYRVVPGLRLSTYNLDATSFDGYEPVTPRVGTFKADQTNHLFSIGFRWALGRPSN